MSEKWSEIEGYVGLYQISNEGGCRSLERLFSMKVNNGIGLRKMKILKPQSDRTGYLYYSLSKNGITKRLTAHRLVAKCFIPNPESKSDVNHKNGIKTDNRVENLEWATRSENGTHAYKLGLNKYTPAMLKLFLKNRKKAKITPNQVDEIRSHRYTHGLYAKLSKQYNVSPEQIKNIFTHKHHTNATKA